VLLMTAIPAIPQKCGSSRRVALNLLQHRIAVGINETKGMASMRAFHVIIAGKVDHVVVVFSEWQCGRFKAIKVMQGAVKGDPTQEQRERCQVAKGHAQRNIARHLDGTKEGDAIIMLLVKGILCLLALPDHPLI
jgi:hypothetical protein